MTNKKAAGDSHDGDRVAEQRYQAVLAVIKDGLTVTETAAAIGVSRQTGHAPPAKYEAGGFEGLVDGCTGRLGIRAAAR